jgi:hypothetical protein
MQPVRITTAHTGRSSDIAARQRRYVISMAIRTVCFIAAVAVGPGWLRWVLIAAAVFLPYVAVVMANAGDNRDDPFTIGDIGPGSRALPPTEEPHGRA